MMELGTMLDAEFLREVAREVPSLLVLVWVVSRFLRCLRDFAEDMRSEREQAMAFQADALKRTEAAIERLDEVVNRNSEVIGRATAALEAAVRTNAEVSALLKELG